MKKAFAPFLLPFLFAAVASMTACSNDGGMSKAEEISSSSEEIVTVPVNYSAGRAMNARLGRGINLGNAWDSHSYASCKDNDCHIPETPYNFGYDDNLDAGWGNSIKDEYFNIIKSAGFNSVRIPVRWQHNSNPTTHEVNPERLAGVLADVQLAINEGLVVIVDFHWYYELMDAANNFESDPANYEAEKTHFLSIWAQVATALNAFPDSMLVIEILNEPTMKSQDLLNDVMLSGYNVIRSIAQNKTIMFESYHASKFADLSALKLPQDGNIIYSGHYYEPYNFTHEGLGYNCAGDDTYQNSASTDLANFVNLAQKLYPDENGGHIPLNMGEFGVAAGSRSSCKNDKPSSDKYWTLWNKKTIAAAEKFDISWTYWDFTKASGFEAFDRTNNVWYTGALSAFFQAE